MKRKKQAPVFQIAISDTDENTGVSLISFVSRPAIEADFVALSSAIKLAKDKHKQILTGPVLIPDKQIFRLSEDEEPFYIQFDADTIERIRNKFHKNSFTHATNDEHGIPLDGNYVVESWTIEDPEKDKAVALGFTDLPAGTWMVSYRVEDADYWEKEIISGNKRGFSLEGLFDYEEVKEQLSKIDMPHKKEKGWFQRMSALKLSTIELEDGTTIVHDPISNKLYSDDNSLLPSGTYKTKQGVTIKVETTVETYQWFYQDREKLSQTDMSKNTKPAGFFARLASLFKSDKAAYDKLLMSLMTLEGGDQIEVDDTTKEVFRLDAEGNRGEAVADGTYTLEDGTTIEVAVGKLMAEKMAANPDVPTAIEWLKKAIGLHMKHLNGEAPTTGEDGEASQMEMMDQMENALMALEGADAEEMAAKKKKHKPGMKMSANSHAAEVEALKATHETALKAKSDEIAKLSAEKQELETKLSKAPAADKLKMKGDKTEGTEALTPAQRRIVELRAQSKK